jgi:hypothetical protein
MSGLTSAITPQVGATPVAYGNPPGPPLPQGAKPIQAKSIPMTLPFSGSVTTVTVDLSTLISQGQIAGAQSIYIDGSQAEASITVTPQATGINKTCPAGAQGIFALAAPPQNQRFTFTSQAASPVGVEFYSYIPDLAVWEAGGSDAPATTVNQGEPGTSPWLTEVIFSGNPVAAGNPFPVTDVVIGATIFNQGTTAPTEGIAVGGVFMAALETLENGQASQLQLNGSGFLRVNDVLLDDAIVTASGAAADSNALQVAGIFNSTLPTRTTGQGGALQTDVNGQLLVKDTLLESALGASGSGAPARILIMGGEFQTTPPTLSNDEVVALQTDTNGNLKVNITNSSIDTNIGATVTENPTELSNGSTNALQSNSFGALQVDATGLLPTYASVTAGQLTAEPGVLATLTGSATKTVKVRRVRISFQANSITTPETALMLLQRNSAAFTGGTGVAGSRIAYDTTDAAPTATTEFFSVPPTGGGTVVGSFRADDVQVAAAGTGIPTIIEWDFSDKNDKPVVLRGTTDILSVVIQNVGTGETIAFTAAFEWTEE